MRTGTATIKDNKYHLKYQYSYKDRCNCHPETCCCGGYTWVSGTHEIEVINPDGLIEGNKYNFELREVEYPANGVNWIAERVYILNAH